jgi:hypothetical protein
MVILSTEATKVKMDFLVIGRGDLEEIQGNQNHFNFETYDFLIQGKLLENANCCFCLSVGRMAIMIAARDINARNFLDDTGRSLLSIPPSPAVLSPFCVLAGYCYLVVIISFPIHHTHKLAHRDGSYFW